MKIPTIILIVLLICSCKNEKTPSIITIDVQSPNGPELKNLSDIATDIQYIPLETHPKALMRFINYLKATDEKYYINTVLELLCFDKTGKFLYKLDKQGRGPEEYTYLTDYDILPDKKIVMVLASSSNKLLFYNETDSGFQYFKKLDLKIRPTYCDFMPNQDNILLSYSSSTGEMAYQFVVINQKGDTLMKKPNYFAFNRVSKVQMGFSNDNIINKTNDVLRLKGLFSDTMFTMTKDYMLIPYMILNTEGKGITQDFLSNVPLPDPNSISPSVNFLMLNEILEVDKYILYRYYYQKTGLWGVYDKTSGKTSQFDVKNLLRDDISGGINIEPKFCYDGVLYTWTDALTFKKYMSENTSQNIELLKPKKAEELQSLAKSMKEDDNHILIVITPKK